MSPDSQIFRVLQAIGRASAEWMLNSDISKLPGVGMTPSTVAVHTGVLTDRYHLLDGGDAGATGSKLVKHRFAINAKGRAVIASGGDMLAPAVLAVPAQPKRLGLVKTAPARSTGLRATWPLPAPQQEAPKEMNVDQTVRAMEKQLAKPTAAPMTDLDIDDPSRFDVGFYLDGSMTIRADGHVQALVPKQVAVLRRAMAKHFKESHA